MDSGETRASRLFNVESEGVLAQSEGTIKLLEESELYTWSIVVLITKCSSVYNGNQFHVYLFSSWNLTYIDYQLLQNG